MVLYTDPESLESQSDLALAELEALTTSALSENELKDSALEFVRRCGSMLNKRAINPDKWQGEVLESKSKQKILNTSRQIGKSTVIGGLCLHKALFIPESDIYVFAPTEKQAKEVFGKIARLYMAYLEAQEAGGQFIPDRSHRRRAARKMRPKISHGDQGLDPARMVRKMGLELPNGSKIEAYPATETSSRGFTADLLVIDEAAFAKDSFYSAIRPSLAVSEGELVLASTPYGKRGFFWDEWRATIDREEAGLTPEWERWEIPAPECPRISGEFLEQELRRLGERHFLQEYMCEFVETEDAVFTQDVIDAAFADDDIEPLWEGW
jgi:hypothetical protein